MKKYYSLFIVSAAIYFIFTGFACGSKELESAKLYKRNKDYKSAIANLQIEIAKNPKSDEGYFMLGEIYAETDSMEQMIKAFNGSLSASNRFAKEIANYKLKYWAENANKGVAYYNRSVQNKNEDSAKIFMDKAVFAFKQSITILPDSTFGYLNLANIYSLTGKSDEALTILNDVLKMQKSFDVYKQIGKIYYEKGVAAGDNFYKNKEAKDSVESVANFDKAIQYLEEARKMNASDNFVLTLLSQSYVANKKFDVAVALFKALAESDKTNKQYLFNYGSVLLEASNYAMAIEQFQAALAIDANYTNALYNTCVAYLRWGAKLVKDAEAESKESPEGREKIAKAKEYLDKYVVAKPDDPVGFELLGKVCSILNLKDEATAAFKKADELRK